MRFLTSSQLRGLHGFEPVSVKTQVAQGAAEISRHGVGTPVFAGMIAASAVGIFVIPMLYVVFQDLRERSGAFAFGAAPPKPPFDPKLDDETG
jgi:hypothetical protein